MRPPVGPSPSLPSELRSALRSLVENRVRPSRDRIEQAMGLVNGAVGDLGSTFQRMRQHAEAQRQRMEDLILRSYRLMNEDEDQAPSSYQGLLGETGRFLQAFGDVLLHFSRHSVEAAHQLDEMSERVEQIFSISEQISQISMDSNLLAINAAIEAANAGEAGKGFAIVATNIRELSKSIDHLNATIQGQAQETRTSIAVLSELISRMASHDLGGALQINRSIDHMRQTIADLATRLEEARTHMKTYAEEVSQNASDAIRLLQFGDITHQVLLQAEAGMASMAKALDAMETGAWDDLELRAPPRDPVAQTDLQAGEIELF